MDSLQGKLLISSGGLYDPNVRHTVVLIGVHDQEGAVGVVLSRATDMTVEEAIPPLTELAPGGDLVYEGGPVEPTQAVLVAEVSRPEILDIFVFQNVGFLVGEVTTDVRQLVPAPTGASVGPVKDRPPSPDRCSATTILEPTG